MLEAFVKPNGFVAAAHVHPSQEERFQVLRGTVGFRLGRKKLVAGPGQRVTVPAGTAHKFWNAGEDEAHFVCEVRPALQFEQLIETMFGLAADGKTNRKGMPNPLRLAVIAQHTSTTCGCPSRRRGCSGSGSRWARRWAGCSATRRRTSLEAEAALEASANRNDAKAEAQVGALPGSAPACASASRRSAAWSFGGGGRRD